MRSRKLKIVRVPTTAELALGTAPRQLELIPGHVYTILPHTDLWMRGAKNVRIKYIEIERESGDWTRIAVAPIVGGSEIRGRFYLQPEDFS